MSGIRDCPEIGALTLLGDGKVLLLLLIFDSLAFERGSEVVCEQNSSPEGGVTLSNGEGKNNNNNTVTWKHASKRDLSEIERTSSRNSNMLIANFISFCESKWIFNRSPA